MTLILFLLIVGVVVVLGVGAQAEMGAPCEFRRSYFSFNPLSHILSAIFGGIVVTLLRHITPPGNGGEGNQDD